MSFTARKTSGHRDIEDAGTRALPEGYTYETRSEDAHDNFLRIRDRKLWEEREAKARKAVAAIAVASAIGGCAWPDAADITDARKAKE